MTRIFDIILLILSRLCCAREPVVPELLTEPVTVHVTEEPVTEHVTEEPLTEPFIEYYEL